ncbi:hypothetical protein [Actinoplanes sp. L3-i22]|uniref:hypothetical protein n=1 Tax=Actinoplanes sp. L3-i22 TaxID=2836373 RepID=UPI001C856149|nr:hypothetical protein [Actinoplanes sp. L3-i22]
MNNDPTPPAPTPTPDTKQAPPHHPVGTPHRFAQHTLRVLAYGLLTGAATAAGKAVMDIVITLIHQH